MDAAARQMRRRLRAARELAGYERVDDLAAAIGERGFGKTTLYEFEQGKTSPLRSHLLRIADACGLPVEWFEVDIAGVLAATRRGERPVPQPSGELGRRLAAHRTTSEDPQQAATPPEEDRRREAGG